MLKERNEEILNNRFQYYYFVTLIMFFEYKSKPKIMEKSILNHNSPQILEAKGIAEIKLLSDVE